ncbi:hypothetical protein D2T29_21185 [Sinirhodobacter populi]|uniref:Uncharacterized protein n=1 Tax=Paenirhodobacter populi TaxID=2306993 RepID=A0A443K0D3_9RHOB|nr:hypothetical protein D2T29_21185 [Sinirhodobacter populi]
MIEFRNPDFIDGIHLRAIRASMELPPGESMIKGAIHAVVADAAIPLVALLPGFGPPRAGVSRHDHGGGRAAPPGICRSIGTLYPIAGDELAAIIDPDRLWISDLSADPFQRLNHVLAPVGDPRICRRAVARMCVHDSQDP